MKDGKVLQINETDLMLRSGKELEHVLFLFKVRNSTCARWKKKIKASIALQRKGLMPRTGEFKPKYIDAYGKEVEMQKNSAQVEVLLGTKVLSFNPDSDKACIVQLGLGIQRSKVPDLRAAIYQIGDSTEELRKIKEEMIQVLEAAEEKLVVDFLN